MSITRENWNRFIPDVLSKDIPGTKNININSASEFILYINSQTKDFFPFLLIFGLVYFTSYQIYLGLYHSTDENPFNDNDFIHHVTKYVFLIFVPVFMLFCYIIHLTFDKQTEYSLFMIFIMFSFLVVILYYILSNITIDFSRFNNYGTLVLLAVIVITGLMILYNIFEKQIRNMDSWVGFTVNLIFYIPCLVDMFFKYMLENYINTPTWIIILFVCELLLILTYIYLIPTIQKKMTENAVVLLYKPVMLNEEHNQLNTEMKKSLANRIINMEYLNPNDNPNAPNIQNLLDNSVYRKHYSISMWMYVNPASYSRIGYTKESNIFYYGHESGENSSYHPKVSLVPVEDQYQFAIYYAGNKKKQFVELPYQKWNNLVFNYREGGVDLFVNGELNYSYSYSTDEMPEYNETDVLIAGDNSEIITKDANGNDIIRNSEFSNGLYGAICNVVYYKNSQSKSQIVRNYNQLHFLNPPILP